MGNQASSCLLLSPPAVVMVGPDGILRRAAAGATAAELMLDFSGHVAARAADLRQTRRVSGICADEQLRSGEAYLLLPVAAVGSWVSDRQMTVILGATKKGRRSGGRVFLETAGDKGEEDRKLMVVISCPHYKIGGNRQWRPVLDTIPESH